MVLAQKVDSAIPNPTHKALIVPQLESAVSEHNTRPF